MENGKLQVFSIVTGLTKREYFAGLAMQGILAKHGLPPDWTHDELAEKVESAAIASVTLADELLKALDK